MIQEFLPCSIILRDALCIRFPTDLVNKIFLYMQSPTAPLIRRSKFYGAPFPFLYLRKLWYVRYTRYPIPPSYAECLAYYQYDVYWKIVQWQHPVARGRYRLGHVHTSSPLPEAYSEDIGVDMEGFYTTFMNTVYNRLITNHMHRIRHIRTYVIDRYRFYSCIIATLLVGTVITVSFLFLFPQQGNVPYHQDSD